MPRSNSNMRIVLTRATCFHEVFLVWITDEEHDGAIHWQNFVGSSGCCGVLTAEPQMFPPIILFTHPSSISWIDAV